MQEIEAFEATIDELREKRLSLKKKLDDQVTSCTSMFGYMHTYMCETDCLEIITCPMHVHAIYVH